MKTHESTIRMHKLEKAVVSVFGILTDVIKEQSDFLGVSPDDKLKEIQTLLDELDA